MPLVYGVCRAASAPKLSHVGSRLNASKPEAFLKTKYPTHKNSLNKSGAVVPRPRPDLVWFLTPVFALQLPFGKTFQIESPLKTSSYPGATGAKFDKNSREFTFSNTALFLRSRTTVRDYLTWTLRATSKCINQNFLYVPEQTIRLAYASVRGMPEFNLGWRNIYVPRH